MRIAQVEVYKFNELNKEVQQKVLDKHRYINTEFDWWDGDYEYFKEQLVKIGIEAETFYFNLEPRYRDFHLEKPMVVDERKFLKFCGVDLRTKEARNIIEEEGIAINWTHTGGGDGYHWIDPEIVNEVCLMDCLKKVLDKFWKELDSEFDGLITDEAIIDTLEANNYEFTKDGELFHLREVDNVKV